MGKTSTKMKAQTFVLSLMFQNTRFAELNPIQSFSFFRQKHELLVVSAYIGALLAIQRKYLPIVTLLFNHARYVYKAHCNKKPCLLLD